jgi:hypothetical protein
MAGVTGRRGKKKRRKESLKEQLQLVLMRHRLEKRSHGMRLSVTAGFRNSGTSRSPKFEMNTLLETAVRPYQDQRSG